MNVIVCIKQVPNTTDVRIDPKTNTLVREGVESVINPFDMYAIEEALRIRERTGWKTVILTMGPPQAEGALREAISMGADEAVLLSDRAFAGSDTWATSYALSQAIKKIGDYGLILCGKQASDGDTAQVGPGIATHLEVPQITYVRKIEHVDEKKIVGERLLEEGYEVIEAPVPCLLTVVKEINEPRLPSLKGKMRAKKQEIPVWSAQDIQADKAKLGLEGSPTRVVKIFSPPPRQGGQLLRGEALEVAAQLVEAIKDEVI